MSLLQEARLAVKERGPRRGDRVAWLFLLPWLLGLFGLTLGPMLASLYLSFTDYPLLSAPKFTGLDNYARMLGDDRLHNALRVTFTYVFVSTPLQLVVALAVALLLNQGMRGLAFYRSVFYLPSLLGSSVAIAILWRQVFGSGGLVVSILTQLGLPTPTSWVADPSTSLWTLILLHVWTFGSPMIIFLAGLRQIPDSYYEAAGVDGAGRWQQFTAITLPLLSPIIFFNLVLQVIVAFQSFTQAFVVSNGTGGPVDSTLFYSLYLYQMGFGRFDMGYASAIGWLLFVIIGAVTLLNFFLAKWWVTYDN